MSRLYYGVRTNLRETDSEHFLPNIDYFAFDNEELGVRVSVSCSGYDDWGIESDSVIDGRWKGLEVCIEDYDDDTHFAGNLHGYEYMTDDDFELLKKCQLYEVGFYIPSDCGYEEGFILEANDAEITIEHGDRMLEIHKMDFNNIVYGD